MTPPIVIVDPVSSGTELAPAFKARGFPVIAVRSAAIADAGDVGYAHGIETNHFAAVYDSAPGLIETLRLARPHAVIAGSESGVALADALAATLTPKLANDLALSQARRHKAHMQAALERAGLPAIRTIDTASIEAVRTWLRENALEKTALVVKPPASAGSDKVFHVAPGGDWVGYFEHILATPTALLGELSETVLVQEMIKGTEYCVDTVSAAGTHTLAHLIRYSKTSAGDRLTVFDHTEFVSAEHHAPLIAFTERVLDALGIRWGAAHSEVMLTTSGPRLIETGARMCGGPVLGFARAATGSSQLERVVEAYADGVIRTGPYTLKQTVVPVFLAAPNAGVLRNVEVLDAVRELPTHFKTAMWRRNGDYVRRTVDFDSTLGIVALAGEREAVFADYHRVRAAEERLEITDDPAPLRSVVPDPV